MVAITGTCTLDFTVVFDSTVSYCFIRFQLFTGGGIQSICVPQKCKQAVNTGSRGIAVRPNGALFSVIHRVVHH